MNTEDMTTENVWDRLVDEDIATDEELGLVTDIMGYRKDVLLDVLFARTGYRNFEQMED